VKLRKYNDFKFLFKMLESLSYEYKNPIQKLNGIFL